MEQLIDIDPETNHFNNSIEFDKHTITSFNNMEISENALKIIHHNARSIMKPGRIEEFESFFNTLNKKFDILIFTETWLTEDNKDYCRFEGYEQNHLIRPIDNNLDFKSRGGGISIFTKRYLNCKYRDDLKILEPFMECQFLELKLNGQLYLIGGMYRIPNTSINSFIDKTNQIIEPLKSTYKIILAGDFNIDFLKNDKYKSDFELCLQSNYLVPTILSATRIATKTENGMQITTESLIDNIFLNNNIISKSGIIESSITDHYSIYTIIPNMIGKDIKTNEIKFKVYNHIKLRSFNQAINQTALNQILNDTNAETAFTQFINIFDETYNKTFPLKTKIISDKDILKPWVNDILVRRIKIRDRLNKLANKNRIEKRIFTEFRNQLTTQLRLAKAKYLAEEFEAN